jgi:aryl-phospho-beta-D-glucosidase BglC (GH1 family)
LTLQVQCPQATQFGIHVNHVSSEAGLVVKANGIVIFQQLLKPGPGAGEWKQSSGNPWGSYDADYDRDYTASVPAGTREIQVDLEQGDWLSFSSIRLNGAVIQVTNQKWGVRQETFIVDAQGAQPANMSYSCSKQTLWDQRVKPWQELAAKGVGVYIGEFGVFNRTPHAVALAWMRDCLENWRNAGFGWALWNLRGSFGILDSERTDVKYEDYNGYKLDRQMLELLCAS